MSVVAALGRPETRGGVAAIALRLARALETDAVLLHVVDPTKAKGYDTLSRAREEIGFVALELDGNEPLAVDVRGNDVVNGVLAVARRTPASWIVVGAGRPRRFSRLFSRNIPQEIVAVADGPVVLVPHGVAPGSATTELAGDAVVCAVDGSPASDHAGVVAAELAGALDLQLVLVHARRAPLDVLPAAPLGAATPVVPVTADAQVTEPPEALVRAVEQMPGTRACVSARFEQGAPATAVEHAAEEERAALVVVGASRDGLAGNTARIARAVRVPTIVVPAEQGR